MSKFLLILFSTGAALLMAEGALRWLLPAGLIYIHPQIEVHAVSPEEKQNQMAGPFLGTALSYVEDPWRYRLKRDLDARFFSSEFDVRLSTGPAGFRGPTNEPTRETDLRILGLGDSFCMGFGVENEQTYLSVLARNLDKSGKRTATLNAGVVGYNLANSFERLKGTDAFFKPDLVVLQVWVGDDLTGSLSPSSPLPRQKAAGLLRLKEAARYSYLSMFMRDRLRSYRPVRHWLLQRNLLVQFKAENILRADLEQAWSAQIDKLASVLSDFQAYCSSRSIGLIVLLLPIKEQVRDEFWQRTIDYNLPAATPLTVDLDAPNKIIRRLAKEHSITLVDATEPLRASKAKPFFDIDPHLNAAGHALVGEALFGKI